MGLFSTIRRLLLGSNRLRSYYAGLDGEGVAEVLAEYPDVAQFLLATGPQLAARFPSAKPTLLAQRALPIGNWAYVSLRLETDLSARAFAAAWAAFDREWWGASAERLRGVMRQPVPVYRTPPHDTRDVVDRFFERRELVDAFLDAHAEVCEALAAGVGELAARYPRGYSLKLDSGPRGPWLTCVQDQPGGLAWGDSPEMRAMRETWGPIAAAAPDHLNPEPVLVRYII